MRLPVISRNALCACIGLLATEQLSAQITVRSGTTGGGKEYLNILAPQSATNIDTLFERTDSLRANVDTLFARVAANEIDWTNIAEPVINFTNPAALIDFDIDDWMLYVRTDVSMYSESHSEWISEDDLVIGSNDDDSYWNTEVDVTDGTDSLDIYIVFDAEDDYDADFDVILTEFGSGVIDGDEMQIISEDDILIQCGASDGNDISIEMVSLANAMAFQAGKIFAAGQFFMQDAVMPTVEPLNPVNGSFYFNGTSLKVYDGTVWVTIN